MEVDEPMAMGDGAIQPCNHIKFGDKVTISVDYFRQNNKAKYQFMTHAHDIEEFTKRTWITPIYCSEKTADVLPTLTRRDSDNAGVLSRFLRPLKTGVTTVVGEEKNVTVTPFDANHCYGSVMYLFEGPPDVFPGPILCTGHFKADNYFLERFDNDPEYEKLRTTNIHTIYFDNTSISLSEHFFSKYQVVAELRKLALNNPAHSIILPFPRLGREEILERLSEDIGEAIELYGIRSKIYDERCKKENVLGTFIHPDVNSCRVRVTPRDRQALSSMMHDTSIAHFFLCEISSTKMFDNFTESNAYRHFPYTDHCTRKELINFFGRISVSYFIPTATPLSNCDYLFLLGVVKERSSSSQCTIEQRNQSVSLTTDTSLTFPCTSSDPNRMPSDNLSHVKIEKFSTVSTSISTRTAPTTATTATSTGSRKSTTHQAACPHNVTRDRICVNCILPEYDFTIDLSENQDQSSVSAIRFRDKDDPMPNYQFTS